MQRCTVPRDIWMCRDKLLERRVDLIEMNVGDETVDSGVDAARCGAEQISAFGDEIGEDLQVRDASRKHRVTLIASDSLIVVPIKIVFPGLLQAAFHDAWMRFEE